MSGIWYRFRAELRGSWRGAVGVAVLAGLLGGGVLAASAGARRTASAYPRMLERTGFPELVVSPPGGPGVDPTPFYDELRAVPGVAEVAVVAGIPAFAAAGTPTAELVERYASRGRSLGVFSAPVDGVTGYDQGRPLIREGRMPDPARVDEAFVSGDVARTAGLGVGDQLHLVLSPGIAVPKAVDPADGILLTVTITGIGVFPDQVIPFSDLDEDGHTLLTPAVAGLLDRSEWDFEGAFVELDPKARVDEVVRRIEVIGAASAHTGGPVFIQDRTASAAGVQDGLRPLAVALGLFAGVLALVAIPIVAQAVSRHTTRTTTEESAMAAVGFTARQRAAVSLTRALGIGVASGVLAVVVAVALSPRFPIGPARVAEPDRGAHVDATVLALGVLGVLAVVTVAPVPAILLRSRRRARRSASAALSRAGGAAGLPPAAVQGVRLALEPAHPGASSPARSTLAASITAVAFVLAASTFAASLASLIDTPERYGQTWDRFLDNQFGPIAAGALVEGWEGHPAIEALAVGSYAQAAIDGLTVPGVAMTSVVGDTGVAVVRGRRAEARGEVALGGETLERLGVDLGDQVEVDTGGGPAAAEVVGEVVFPRFNQGSFNQTGLGTGAQFHPDTTGSGFLDLVDEPLPPGFELGGHVHSFVAVELRPDAPADAVAALDADIAQLAQTEEVFSVRYRQPPTTISDLARVREVPMLLAGVLVAAAAGVLSHLLLTAVRSRRRELALLSTLGFTKRQLQATVRWQASVVATAAVVAGAPVGLVVGRVVWRAFADGIHAPSTPVMPWWWLALALPAGLVVANLAAAVPARRARRTPPALVLRRE